MNFCLSENRGKLAWTMSNGAKILKKFYTRAICFIKAGNHKSWTEGEKFIEVPITLAFRQFFLYICKSKIQQKNHSKLLWENTNQKWQSANLPYMQASRRAPLPVVANAIAKHSPKLDVSLTTNISTHSPSSTSAHNTISLAQRA